MKRALKAVATPIQCVQMVAGASTKKLALLVIVVKRATKVPNVRAISMNAKWIHIACMECVKICRGATCVLASQVF